MATYYRTRETLFDPIEFIEGEEINIVVIDENFRNLETGKYLTQKEIEANFEDIKKLFLCVPLH